MSEPPDPNRVRWTYDEWDEDGPLVAYLVIENQWHTPFPGGSDWNPHDWWQIEAITGIGAARFRGAKKKEERERLFDDVVERVAQAQAEAARATPPPHPSLGFPEWRRWVVHTRYQVFGLKPYCFVSRAAELPDRARALMADAYGLGRQLFRMQTQRGSWPACAYLEQGRVAIVVGRDRDTAAAIVRRAVKFVKSGHPPQQVPVPNPVASEVRNIVPEEWPVLAGRTTLPVLDPETGGYRPQGYDPRSKLMVDPAWTPAVGAPIHQNLTDALTPFNEFPLVDGFGPLLALMLDFATRGLFEGPRPLFVVDAPPGGQGTGKTLLARSVAALAMGTDPSVMVLPTSEGETEKRISAAVRAAAPVHIFDNVTGTVRSTALAALATTSTWGGRTLGLSEAMSVPQVTTWVLTANGARMNRDLARRCLFVRLDRKMRARTVTAGGRSGFTILDLVGYLRQPVHRMRVLSGLYGLVQGWLASGQPKPLSLEFDSYEAWGRVVGGILDWVDAHTHSRLKLAKGLAEALHEAERRDEDDAEMREFLIAWFDAHGLEPVRAAALAKIAEAQGLFAEHLDRPGGESWKARRLAQNVLREMAHLKFQMEFRPTDRSTENAETVEIRIIALRLDGKMAWKLESHPPLPQG